MSSTVLVVDDQALSRWHAASRLDNARVMGANDQEFFGGGYGRGRGDG
jgi:hypothetical protein